MVQGSKRGGRLLKCVVNGQTVVCGLVDGRPFAFDSTCPHEGGPPEKGMLAGERIQCSWHSYEFGVFSGGVTKIPYSAAYGKWRETRRMRIFGTRLDEGEIFVEMGTTRE